MIGRRELDSLEARISTAPRVGPGSREQRRLERAIAASASGTWTWDDARLVFGQQAERSRAYYRKDAWKLRRSLEETPYQGGTANLNPTICVAFIVTTPLDEEVPAELSEYLLRLANTPTGWNVTLPDCAIEWWDNVTTAVMYMVALETPDALKLRQEIWTPDPTTSTHTSAPQPSSPGDHKRDLQS
jgi:hypothetical protein